MEVILLERVAKLGQMGEVVRVRDGYARNFLLKRNKALRATADNRAKFDGMKAELEARNLQAKGEATKVAEKIGGRNVVVLRQASETGQLFGSVSVRDIIASFEADGVAIERECHSVDFRYRVRCVESVRCHHRSQVLFITSLHSGFFVNDHTVVQSFDVLDGST